VAIDGGGDFSMAVSRTGPLSLGHNLSGVLGIADTAPTQVTTITNVLSLTNIISVACDTNMPLALGF